MPLVPVGRMYPGRSPIASGMPSVGECHALTGECILSFLRNPHKIQPADFPSLMEKPRFGIPPPLSLLTTKRVKIYQYDRKFLRVAGLQSHSSPPELPVVPVAPGFRLRAQAPAGASSSNPTLSANFLSRSWFQCPFRGAAHPIMWLLFAARFPVSNEGFPTFALEAHVLSHH